MALVIEDFIQQMPGLFMASSDSSVIEKNKTAHKRDNHHQLINQKMNKNTK